MYGEFLVAQTHDFLLGSPRGDFEAVGQSLAFDDERVVAGGFKGLGHAVKDAGAVMVDGGGFAMHEAIRTDDVSAIDLADALVAETDAEHGDVWAKGGNDLAGDTCFIWRAGARGDANAGGLERADGVDVHDIVADDFHFGTQLAEILDEVVGERVVIIYDEEHRSGSVFVGGDGVGEGDGFEHAFGFVAGFFVFVSRVGIGNDSAACLDVGFAVFDQASA